jgi:DNA topoisomerase-1
MKIKNYKLLLKNTTDENKKMLIKNKISDTETKITILNDYNSLAINTSKMNYIDPRILYSFCNENKIDITKFYTKKLIDKFKWASSETNFNY